MKGYCIQTVHARQVLDSKGRPVVEVDIRTEDGTLGRAGASCGTSVGSYETFVLRDRDPKCFAGLSVYQAVENVNRILAPALIGKDVRNQAEIDQTMIDLDGSENKENLGGNAIYAASVAAAKAAAVYERTPLYRYLAQGEINTVYVPAYNMINGGTYGEYTLDFQEFLVIPYRAESFAHAVRMGVEIFYEVGNLIGQKLGRPAYLGNYCGHGAPTNDPYEALGLLQRAAENLGYEQNVCFALDCAASGLYDPKTETYRLMKKQISRDEMLAYLLRLTQQFPIGFIEDPLDEEDFYGFSMAKKNLPTHIIGDDLLVTNIKRAQKAVRMDAISGMIFKPNMIGTLSEAMHTASYLKQENRIVIPSLRSGGMVDDPISELAISCAAPLMKTGAPRSAERTRPTNFGLRVEEEEALRLFDLSSLPYFDQF